MHVCEEIENGSVAYECKEWLCGERVSVCGESVSRESGRSM